MVFFCFVFGCIMSPNSDYRLALYGLGLGIHWGFFFLFFSRLLLFIMGLLLEIVGLRWFRLVGSRQGG